MSDDPPPDNVVTLQLPKKEPARHSHKEVVSTREMFAQPEPSEQQVWALCPYIRGMQHDFTCLHCPNWVDDPEHGRVMRGCFAMTREACRVVHAVLKREGKVK